MDKELKQLIKDNKLSDEHIMKVLKAYKEPAEEAPADEQEEEQVVEEEADEEPADPPKKDKEVDLNKLIEAAVAKALKGVPRQKPKPTKKPVKPTSSVSGFGLMP